MQACLTTAFLNFQLQKDCYRQCLKPDKRLLIVIGFWVPCINVQLLLRVLKMVIKQINTLLSTGTNFKMDVYAIKSILFAQWNGVNVNILGIKSTLGTVCTILHCKCVPLLNAANTSNKYYNLHSLSIYSANPFHCYDVTIVF